MSQRKIVDVPVSDSYVDFDDILGSATFDQVIEKMQSYKKRFAGRDVYFDIQSYGYDGGMELKLRERRLETDKEYEKRIALEKKASDAEKKAKLEKEESERKEYERLKKKYG